MIISNARDWVWVLSPLWIPAAFVGTLIVVVSREYWDLVLLIGAALACIKMAVVSFMISTALPPNLPRARLVVRRSRLTR